VAPLRDALPPTQVLEGGDLLDARNDTEQKKLKKVRTQQLWSLHHWTGTFALLDSCPEIVFS
jgi:hypothetical protein